MEATSAPGYEHFLFYKLSTVIYDVTVQFTKKHIPHYSRTRDQMDQAARSGRQNVAEGYRQQSLKGFIKLSGVALGSLEELLKDYEDYARQNEVKVLPKDTARNLEEVKEVWILLNSNPTYRPDHPYQLPTNLETAINLMLTLINQATYLLRKHISALEQKFITEGGFSENLAQKRREHRGY